MGSMLTLAETVKTTDGASALAIQRMTQEAGPSEWAIAGILKAESIRGNGWFCKSFANERGAAYVVAQDGADLFSVETSDRFIMVVATPNGAIETVGSANRDNAFLRFNRTANEFRRTAVYGERSKEVIPVEQYLDCYPGEARVVFHHYGKPVSLIAWADGREYLMPGTVKQVIGHLAECLTADGHSAEFNVSLATANDIDRLNG